MSDPAPRPGGDKARGKGWGLATAAFVGLWLIQNGSADTTPPVPSAAQAFAAGPHQHTSAAADPLPPAAPYRVRIPDLKVDAPLMRLGLASDGSLEVPPAANRNIAGWYAEGPAPGAEGAAVLAGHVDNDQGPAVFYSLGTLRKGHRVEVDRADGRTAVFTVDAVEVYDNDAFPDDKVYGGADRAELRVITCGGAFDRRSGGYQANVVAFGHLIGVRQTVPTAVSRG
ncbi:class F sortase [Streptomyces lichenis]|uniref:Class F sortase n=1 Tax=Streptomyces lichenis TaxID=2306967 RepID=A0ABT0I6K1_9ACTN|nr:class F sortase [Streptomyces lichenis]MCK8676955.1 class F sortase [Streptomyces lichenis]